MGGVSLTTLLFFTRQFTSMVKSHLHLRQILDGLALDPSTHKSLRPALKDIAWNVSQGMELDTAMSKHSDVFDKGYTSIISSGIQTSQLGVALEHLTEYLENEHKNRARLRVAISYPVFVFAIFLVMFHLMIFMILPRFAELYANQRQGLPALTQFVIDISQFYKDYWFLFLGFFSIPIAVIFSMHFSENTKRIWDEHKLSWPLVGPMWRMSALGRFLSTLAIQVKNGVSLINALRLAGKASDNLYLQQSSDEIINSIEKGVSLGNAFFQHEKWFNNVIMQMIRAAEESGSLAEPLLMTAKHFDYLLQSRITIVTDMVTPVFTILLGLVISAMLIATFLPVFQLGNLYH